MKSAEKASAAEWERPDDACSFHSEPGLMLLQWKHAFTSNFLPCLGSLCTGRGEDTDNSSGPDPSGSSEMLVRSRRSVREPFAFFKEGSRSS